MGYDKIMSLDTRRHRSTYKNKNGILFQTCSAPCWCGLDFRKKPYVICVRDRKNNFVLYSTGLYHFKTEAAAKEFCAKIIEEGSMEKLQKELIAHWCTYDKVIIEKCKPDADKFLNKLEKLGITITEMKNIYEEYIKLPLYIKKYLKEFHEPHES